jgi:hypothetical protein
MTALRKTAMRGLSHSCVPLWTESKILDTLYDADGNAKPLRTFVKEIQKFATHVDNAVMTHNVATEFPRLIGSDFANYHEIFNPVNPQKNIAYSFVFGAMGEVLCQYYLNTFGHMYGLSYINDTSFDQFFRGIDFNSSSMYIRLLKVFIQVKMRKQSNHVFSAHDLFTFFDELKKASIHNRFALFMVPTSDAVDAKTLFDWRDGFNDEAINRLTVITGRNMTDMIWSSYDFGPGHDHPNLIFFDGFSSAIKNSVQKSVS